MNMLDLARWLQSPIYSFALRRQTAPPQFLWSKGISQGCDFKGSVTYWLAETESRQSESFFLRHYGGAHGLVWVRLGSRAREGFTSDLDSFVRAALPTIRKPFSLVTTDGDASVPSDLSDDTVGQLLKCPWLKSWYTQNHDGYEHAKLAPIPIGLDLHTPRLLSPQRLVSRLQTISDQRLPVTELPLRVLCDLGVSLASEDRQNAVTELRGCDHVDFLDRRISQTAVWKQYVNYPFVLSAAGNGLDCHRTWELLYLGCIVITKRSSLDPLYEGLPVALVDEWEAVRNKANLAKWLQQYGALTDVDRVWKRLKPDQYLKPIREALNAAGT